MEGGLIALEVEVPHVEEDPAHAHQRPKGHGRDDPPQEVGGGAEGCQRRHEPPIQPEAPAKCGQNGQLSHVHARHRKVDATGEAECGDEHGWDTEGVQEPVACGAMAAFVVREPPCEAWRRGGFSHGMDREGATNAEYSDIIVFFP